MRVGIYLGRYPALGGGMKVYAHEFVRNCPDVLKSPEFNHIEVVFFGDSSVWDNEILKSALPAGTFSFGAKEIDRAMLKVASPEICEQGSVVLRQLPNFGNRQLGYLFDQMLMFFYTRIHKLDLVHSVSNVGFLTFRVPQIVTVHDLFQAWPSEDTIALERKGSLESKLSLGQKWRRAAVRNVYKFVFKKQFKRPNLFLADCQTVADEIGQRYGVRKEFLRVVSLGVDHEFATWIKKARADSGCLEKSLSDWQVMTSIRAGFVAVLASSDPRKNTAAILQAWAKLPKHIKSCGLVIALSDERAKWMVDEFKQGLGDERKLVTVLNRLARWEMPLFFRSARVLAHPTLGEGFGLPIIEAASVGCRVVCAPLELVESFPEVRSRIFVCNPLCTEDIAAEIANACPELEKGALSCEKSGVAGDNEFRLLAQWAPLPIASLRSMKDSVRETFEIYKSYGEKENKNTQ